MANDYNIYVAQERGGSLHLYTFSSKELVQPTASAYQYGLLLAQSAGQKTSILRGDASLRKFLKKYWETGRIVRGKIRNPNPRNSKVKDALASEATRFRKFDDFARTYWDACARGLYWIAVDEKKFKIDEYERKRISGGSFTVSCSPSLALTGKNEGKKYVAELDVTRVPGGSIRIKRGSTGSEVKITGSAGSVKVNRVLEADKAQRAFKWQLSILPSSKEGLREVWDKAWAKRRREDAKSAVRLRKEKERDKKRAEVKQRGKSPAKTRRLRIPVRLETVAREFPMMPSAGRRPRRSAGSGSGFHLRTLPRENLPEKFQPTSTIRVAEPCKFLASKQKRSARIFVNSSTWLRHGTCTALLSRASTGL